MRDHTNPVCFAFFTLSGVDLGSIHYGQLAYDVSINKSLSQPLPYDQGLDCDVLCMVLPIQNSSIKSGLPTLCVESLLPMREIVCA